MSLLDTARKPLSARLSRRAVFPATNSSLQPNYGTTGDLPLSFQRTGLRARPNRLSLAVLAGRSPRRTTKSGAFYTTELEALC